MQRGMFNSLTTESTYANAKKNWFIQLDTSIAIWYGLLKKEGELNSDIHMKSIVTDMLKKIKNEVEENLEKRFIYFIATRPKVRFNTKKKPSFNPITKNNTLHIIIGNNKKKKIKFKYYDELTEEFIHPSINLTEYFITISFNKNKISTSVHDFLLNFDINLGLPTEIHYVGITKNPHTRPTNGAHAGFNDVLYEMDTENEDVFLFFNIFKVTTLADNSDYNLSFFTTNSMTDEIKVEQEGNIIEKALILYFDSKTQYNNKDKEKAELENSLNELYNKHNINTLQMHYEFGRKNEYWKFYSSNINSTQKHIFTLTPKNKSFEISYKSERYEYYNNMGAIQ